MKRQGILIISAILLTLATAEAKSIKGQYSFEGENVKGLKAWIAGKPDTVRLDKRGKFRIKNVDCKSDTLVFEKFKNQSIVVPLNNNSIVSVLRNGTKTDIELRKEERKPSGSYGGNIYTKADLEQTGETSVLKAVAAKSPQNCKSSFLLSNTPLYYVDGVEVGSIDHTVKEVAFVEVVKATHSGSSAFGVRGANGAILVTTEVKWKSMMEE